MRTSRTRSVVFLGALSLAIVVDAFTKIWANNTLVDITFPLISEILTIQLVQNAGIAFGLWLPGIAIITPILIGIIGWHYWTVERLKPAILIHLGFGLILWWAIWNGWERVTKGEVTDFIFVHGFSVFNIADICINVGVAVLIISYLLAHKRDRSSTT